MTQLKSAELRACLKKGKTFRAFLGRSRSVVFRAVQKSCSKSPPCPQLQRLTFGHGKIGCPQSIDLEHPPQTHVGRGTYPVSRHGLPSRPAHVPQNATWRAWGEATDRPIAGTGNSPPIRGSRQGTRCKGQPGATPQKPPRCKPWRGHRPFAPWLGQLGVQTGTPRSVPCNPRKPYMRLYIHSLERDGARPYNGLT